MLPGKILEAINPYTLYLKIGLGLVVLLTVIGFLWSWHGRGLTIERLQSYQDSVVLAATEAAVLPDRNGKRKLLSAEAVLAVIPSLKAQLDDSLAKWRQMSSEAEIAKQRADEADKLLDQRIAEFDKRYKAATRRISNLEARVAAATPEEAHAVISGDSRAAWEGWR